MIKEIVSASISVCLAHPIDPSFSVQGGAVRYTLNLLNYLVKHGYTTTLVGASYGKHKKPYVFTFVPIDGFASSCSWQVYFMGLLLRAPFLKLPKSTIIHTCRLEYLIPFIIYYPRNLKVVTLDAQLKTFQTKHPLLFRVARPFLVEFMKFVLRHINKFLAAKSTVDYYAAIYPQIKYKTEVMPTSAVPTELFKPMNKVLLRRKYRINQESKLVIFVGRVEKIKNLEFLIRSFALVKGKLPNAKLVIVGRGSPSYIKHLQKLAKNLNIGEEIIFLGERRYDEIPEILNCADVMALCSLTEGSPTVVREALACGVPVVSTDVGDVKMIIRNKYVGRIVEEDEKKFAEAIIDMLNVNAEVVREECVKLIKELKLDFESLGEKILSVYCEMLQQQMKFNDLRRCKS